MADWCVPALPRRIRGLPLTEDSARLQNWEFLGHGRHRRTYGLPGDLWVVKFPKGRQGVDANRWEADQYARSRREPSLNGICYARCRIVPGADVLVMERVITRRPFSVDFEWPSWSHLCDGGQVGLARNGQVVAYDYADFV